MPKARIIDLNNIQAEEGEKSLLGAIGIGNAIEPEDVIRLVHSTGMKHIVQKNGLAFESEVAVAKAMIQTPGAYFDNPIEVILGLSEEALQLPTLKIMSAMDEKKTNVLSQFESYLTALPGTKTIREQALLIADELYTNAAKNAWAPNSKPGDRGPMREGSVEFIAKTDGTRLIIAVKDTYGELGLSRIIERINSCFQNGIAQSIQHGTGGAGIGSFMVFSRCISYYAGVEKGRRTVVCTALPLGCSQREMNQMPKNIHLLSVA